MKNIVILGTGGNAIDILDTLRDANKDKKTRYRCIGFLDDAKQLHGSHIHEVKVLGPLEQAQDLKNCFFVNGIGNPNNFWLKKTIINKTGIKTEQFATICHPSASISKLSSLGWGTVVLQNVTIASHVVIGNHVIILPHSVVSHDASIADYTCIAGGVGISGGVSIGHSCYLGTHCAIREHVKIGNQCLIGMGSMLLHSVEDNQVMVGTPAKRLRNTI